MEAGGGYALGLRITDADLLPPATGGTVGTDATVRNKRAERLCGKPGTPRGRGLSRVHAPMCADGALPAWLTHTVVWMCRDRLDCPTTRYTPGAGPDDLFVERGGAQRRGMLFAALVWMQLERDLTLPDHYVTVKGKCSVPIMTVCTTVDQISLAHMTTSRYDQIMKTFGKRLKKARMEAGYRSGQSFAAALGMEPHSYRKYERGQSEPNFENLIRMCELLKKPTSYFLPVKSVDDNNVPSS